MTIGYNPFDEDFNYGRLDDYKQGFKDGVEAVRIQLKERANKETVRTIFNEYITYYIVEEVLDEICKELVD